MEVKRNQLKSASLRDCKIRFNRIEKSETERDKENHQCTKRTTPRNQRAFMLALETLISSQFTLTC